MKRQTFSFSIITAKTRGKKTRAEKYKIVIDLLKEKLYDGVSLNEMRSTLWNLT